MAPVNSGRVLLGALAGGIVWNLWSIAINMGVLRERYAAAQKTGSLLAQPRYPFFVGIWILTLFVLAYILAWFYASVRATRGAGPGMALRVGLLIGFAAAFPLNLSTATWSPLSRVFPLWWMLDMWVGAVLAAFVAGWLYRE